MIKKVISKTLVYAILIIGGIITIMPFAWMISTSLKPAHEVMMMPPVWIPTEIMWENYVRAMEMAPFLRYAINSVIVTVSVTVLGLITTIFAAFAFSKMRFYGRGILFAMLIATIMIPGEVLLIPNFVTLSNLGWIDTYKALIIPWTASVFSIFLMRQFFLGIPEELAYAAKIDGCSDFKFLWLIMVPLLKPALVTIALLKIVGSWNAFLWPLIMTNSAEMRTLPVGLSAFSSEAGIIFELLMAGSAMIILPIIIVYLFLQKYIVQGVARAGIKG